MKKNIYIQLSLCLLFSMVSPGQSQAADSPPAALLNDLVILEGSRFIIDKHLHCKLRLPPSLGGGTPFNSFGMHVRFTAPATGLISRDRFVALSMRLFTEAKARLAGEIPGLTTEQTLLAMQCNEVSTSDNNTEYEYFVTMKHDTVISRIQTKQRKTERVINESWETVLRNISTK